VNVKRNERRGLTVARLARFVIAAMVVWVALPAPAASADTYSPGPVTNMQVSTGSKSLTLSWSPPSNAGTTYSGSQLTMVEYYVWLSKPGYTGTAGSCTTAATTCTITGLENGVDYWAEVKAYNSYYYSSYAGPFGPHRPCCDAPTSPTPVSASAGDGVASVSWGAPANAKQSVGPFTYSVSSQPAGLACSTTGSSCDFSGLVNGTTYSFYVTASTKFGTSPPGVSTAVMPRGLPSAPTSVVGYLGSKGSVEVTWLGPEVTGGVPIVEYVATATPGGATCTSSGATSCVISGLQNGQSYTFTVTARNLVGTGPTSAASPVARPLAGPGKARSVKAARVGTTAAKVTWLPPASSGGLSITKYTVKSSPGGKTCTTKQRTCRFEGLQRGTTYVFTVQAHNSKGPGVPQTSNKVTMPAPPTPPVTSPTPTTPTPTEPEKPTQSLS
jgi:hypothetical protein